jgi:phosphohistidine phosphatase
MLVLLMQHGACLSKEIHPDQPLSPVGQGQVERAARAMRLLGLRPRAMAASTRTRARQTAEIVARTLGFNPDRITCDEALRPSDPAEESLRFLHAFDKAEVLFVAGHLPSLNLLASRLMSPFPEPLNLGFENGGLLCLETTHLAAQNASLLWLLQARHLQLLAGS